jgi:hypothetical protein
MIATPHIFSERRSSRVSHLGRGVATKELSKGFVAWLPNRIISFGNLSKTQSLPYVKLHDFLLHSLGYTQNCLELVLGCLTQEYQGGATLYFVCPLLELEQHLVTFSGVLGER